MCPCPCWGRGHPAAGCSASSTYSRPWAAWVRGWVPSACQALGQATRARTGGTPSHPRGRWTEGGTAGRTLWVFWTERLWGGESVADKGPARSSSGNSGARVQNGAQKAAPPGSQLRAAVTERLTDALQRPPPHRARSLCRPRTWPLPPLAWPLAPAPPAPKGPVQQESGACDGGRPGAGVGGGPASSPKDAPGSQLDQGKRPRFPTSTKLLLLGEEAPGREPPSAEERKEGPPSRPGRRPRGQQGRDKTLWPQAQSPAPWEQLSGHHSW